MNGWLKPKYIRYCQYATATNKRSALRLALWDGSDDLTIQPKDSRFKLLIRGDSSDAEVFSQIFIQQEYSSLLDLKDVDLVIDAGANVGYSSFYFLTHFPNCRVLAVEPDAANFAALQTNLAPFGKRAIVHNCGIWSKQARLAIASNLYRDGRQWTRQVRECAPDEQAEFTAITIAELLRQSGCQRLSLLKMDIEGAEAVVFADSAVQEWLGRTDAIAIELHDDTSFGEATPVFAAAIRQQPFQVSRCGELTLCRR